MKPLWEYEHPYFCEEGNYLHSPARHGYLDVAEQHDKSVSVDVTADDEPAVRAWLTNRAKTITQIWEPLISSDDMKELGA